MKLRALCAVYHSSEVRAWEQRWFSAGNSAYGLMQQAALAVSQSVISSLEHKQTIPRILLWCGVGNNAGDGYLCASYLQYQGFNVSIFAPLPAQSEDAKRAERQAQQDHVPIYQELPKAEFNVHIDALFGIGLSRELSAEAQTWIQQFNASHGYKIAIDIPSGLHPDLGIALPIATQVDLTLAVMALKTGLLIAQASRYVGELQVLSLIPKDHKLEPAAYLNLRMPQLKPRMSTQHKGDSGHVLVIGGHPDMGGAVIMAAEAAMAAGAGKVTVMTDCKHHGAILARSPNLMLKDIQDCLRNDFADYLAQIDVLCFGMGLGRDDWAAQIFSQIYPLLLAYAEQHNVILDADALWFMSQLSDAVHLNQNFISTPHSAEAARLLDCSVQQIESNRLAAIENLYLRYGGQWVLKGAGSLSWQEGRIYICGFGNAGMATAGMGDVLSGMIAALKAQFAQSINLADIVSLHALAGDALAKNGSRGIQAQQMPAAIQQVVNYQG